MIYIYVDVIFSKKYFRKTFFAIFLLSMICRSENVQRHLMSLLAFYVYTWNKGHGDSAVCYQQFNQRGAEFGRQSKCININAQCFIDARVCIRNFATSKLIQRYRFSALRWTEMSNDAIAVSSLRFELLFLFFFLKTPRGPTAFVVASFVNVATRRASFTRQLAITGRDATISSSTCVRARG